MAGTRAQSCDRYGSGTLHPGQVLGGSLSLLSPAFKRSHFSRQVPPSATTREILAAKGGRRPVVFFPKFRLPLKFRDLLHAANLRHGTDGFTSPPKEGVLRIFWLSAYEIINLNLHLNISVLHHYIVRVAIYTLHFSSVLLCTVLKVFALVRPLVHLQPTTARSLHVVIWCIQ